MTVYLFPGSPLLYVWRDGGFYPLSLKERDRAKKARAEKKLIVRDGWSGEVL